MAHFPVAWYAYFCMCGALVERGRGTVWAGHCVCIGQWSSKCAASGEPIYMKAGPTDGDIYGGRQLRAVVAAACCGVRR